ncbi:hypothetical protein [Pseudoclavibacter sp. AY1H1]|uniref:hypothetical protein n=1 Tax=Pseudoclavibacter sp. AY1H1 TaxID=2080584 RepID=UPI000CE90933|nr:hypothetical protein [Pseudoclavibacter sp. AY1H1]PPF32609.1 hypothetical protein C5E05_19080 [Pseudoclavibacter sp. AY1H1]
MTALLLASSITPPVVSQTLVALIKRDHLISQLAEARSEFETLATRRVRGDDPRLENFWDDAHEISRDHEWCEVYDRIVEAMRGPERYQESDYDVTVTVSLLIDVPYTVRATSADSARDVAYDSFETADAIEYMRSYGNTAYNNVRDIDIQEVEVD